MSDNATPAVPAAPASPADSSSGDISEAEEIALSEQESKDKGEQPKSAEQKAIEKQIKKFKLKVDGEDVEDEIDLSNEEELKKRLQLAKVAQKRMAAAAEGQKKMTQMQADLEEFFEELRNNPLEILNHPELGLNMESIVENYVKQQLEQQSKSPEQIELDKAKKRLEELEAEKKAIEDERERAKREQFEANAAQELSAQIEKAITDGQLPASKYVTKKLADYAAFAYEQGIDIELSELVPLVQKNYERDIEEMLGKMPDEVVERLLKPERVRSIRNKQLQAVRAKNTPAPQIVDTGVHKVEEKPAQKISAKDFWKSLGKGQ